MGDYCMNDYLFLAVAITHPEMVEAPVLDEDGYPTYDPDTGEPITELVEIQVTNYPYHAAVNTGMLDEQYVMEVLHTVNPLLPGDTLVAHRLAEESVATIDNAAIYEQIRPFGNNPDGSATGVLLYHYIDGYPVRLFQSGDPYPVDNEPFDAEIRHKYFETPATPVSTGWGFRFELIGAAHTRDPSARAIGAYSDPECTQYLWTTGALQLGTSDWQTDELGTPLEVWYTDSWDGDRPASQKDWHVAMLLGSAQEGHQTLPAGSDGVEYLFWQYSQPGEGEWVDTGATIISQAGTIYQISDEAEVARLSPGQPIKLGELETTFTGVWAGGADYIEINPFVQATVGDPLWSFE